MLCLHLTNQQWLMDNIKTGTQKLLKQTVTNWVVKILGAAMTHKQVNGIL